VKAVGRALLAALLVALAVAAPTSAASPTFEAPKATFAFGKEITFTQAFDSPFDLTRVEILLEYPESLGPYVVQVEGPTGAGRQERVHQQSLADGGSLVPNTPITARWRLVPADRTREPVVGPPVTILYADTRFSWRTVEGDLVRVHWYEGSEAFARDALAIGEKAVRDASTFLGVTEAVPVDFYVYADQEALYVALGARTRENVGGQANASIRTLFALIAPNAVAGSEVRRIVPHELTHLVFDTAVRNPYNFPPRWLNEGIALYMSEGYTFSDRSAVEAAAPDGRLMPLRGLGGLFPSTAMGFFLAYSESVSAVDYLIRENGTAALVKLVRSYANGVTDDEAFTDAVGMDVAGFEAAWLADLGAEAPTRHGPQPAPPGPLPPGWDSVATPVPLPASPAPGASPTAPPAVSPVASPIASLGPGPGGPSDDGGSQFREGWVLVVAALAGLLVGGTLALVRRRRARRVTDRGAS
jgi:hypothetical protein